MNIETPNPAFGGLDPDPADVDATVTDTGLLQQELAGQKELHLRLAADFDNFKRRSRQEGESRAGAQKDAFIHELLPVIDNLERALAAGVSAGSEQFRQGVEMTLQQLRRLLRQHGIDSDDIVGQPFDPHQHEAVYQRHDPARPDHTILEMFQRGYRRGAKVLRPAKVVVNNRNPAQPDPQGW